MTKCIAACLFVVTFAGLTGLSENGVAEEIHWLDSAQQAVNQADRSGQMILVYVGSKRCHYCVKMEKNVWSDANIAKDVSRDFIPLKLSPETHRELVSNLKVKGFPATLIFTSDRRLIGRFNGYVSPAEMSRGLSKLRIATREDPAKQR